MLSTVNVKGGSGKTIITSLLALALANRGLSVLAVDRDPQGGLTTMLYQDNPTMNPLDFIHAKTVIRAYQGYGEVLLSPASVSVYRYILEKGYPSVLQQEAALKDLADASLADIMLIDTPPEPNPFLVSAVNISPAMIVPVTRSRSTIRGLLLTLHILTLPGVKPPSRVLVVMNGFDRREERILDRLRETIREVTSSIPLPPGTSIAVLETHIPRSRLIEDATAAIDTPPRAMISLYERNERIARAAGNLADEVLQHLRA